MSLRAAEMSEGDAREVFMASGMNLFSKTPVGGVIVAEGSAWM